MCRRSNGEPKTTEYPTTTYEITFSGSIISKGTLKRMAIDDEFFADEIIFTPSDESLFPKEWKMKGMYGWF
ncbi:hypothetical protein KHA80_00010 [Anaerobacillus sp. HL2]|nr:hypothetical protein KHA80_00010 [Anaerobacillus sp. HL2]